MLDGKDDKILRLNVTEVGLVRHGKGAATKIIDSSGVLDTENQSANQN